MADGAFAVEVVSPADPILPKIDLVLGPEGLEWAEEPSSDNRDPTYNELVQSVVMGLLMQRGDYRYNRAKGMPWTQHDRMRESTAILGSNMTGANLRRIEVAVMSELPRTDPRVVTVESVEARVLSEEDFANRRLWIRAQFRVTTGDLVGVETEVKV
jgi:hypothetical protein